MARAATDPELNQSASGSRIRRQFRSWLLYPTMLLVGFALLWNRGMDMAQALERVRQIDLPLLGLALGIEALRFGGMGFLLYTLATTLGVRPPLASTIRLTLVAVAARHLLPAAGIPDYALR